MVSILPTNHYVKDFFDYIDMYAVIRNISINQKYGPNKNLSYLDHINLVYSPAALAASSASWRSFSS